MNINASLDALGNLLALIQASNPGFSAVTEDQVTVVSVAAQAADDAGRNAAVAITVAGYTDTASFTFTQLGLTDNVATPNLSLNVTSAQSASDVHQAIAAQLGLVQDEVGISSDAFDANGNLIVPTSGTTATATLAANPTSLLYVAGSQVTVTLNFPAVVPPVNPSISTIVTATALAGFTAVAAPAADGTSSPATDGTTPPAADGTTSAPTDGTTSAPTDGTTSAPAADGTTSAPAADGTSAATDGTAAAGTDGQAPAATN